MGPSIVIATSSRADGSGGSNIYLEAAGRLLVASRSQVRRAQAAEVDAWCILTGSEPVLTIDKAKLRVKGQEIQR